MRGVDWLGVHLNLAHSSAMVEEDLEKEAIKTEGH